MVEFSISWVAFLLTYTKTKVNHRGTVYILISTIFILISLILHYTGAGKEEYLFPAIYTGIYGFINRNRENVYRQLPFIALLFLSFISILNIFLNLPYTEYIIPLSPLMLLINDYREKILKILWFIIPISISLSFFISKEMFFFLNVSIPLVLMYETLLNLDRYVRRSKNIYTNILDTALKAELDKQHNSLNNELSIAYKRLKEIFKLSNKTIEPIEIDEILENVTKGLSEQGYTGVLVYISFKDIHIHKKSGFFPNMKLYIEKVLPFIEELEISEDSKIVHIPLYTDRGKIGVLSVYKKTDISPSEVEYLRTYANSVAISIAKTIYFKEIGYLENILSKIFETLDIGLVVLNKKFDIEISNSAMEKIFGKKAEKNLFETYPELKNIKENLKEVLEKNKSLEMTYQIENKTYRIKAVKASHEEDKIVLLIEDITDIVKLERQLMESEKHIELGRIVAGLSHDVKNPISSILAYAYSLKKRLKDNEKLVDIIEKIENKAKVAGQITQRLINYVNPEYEQEKIINIKEPILEAVEVSVPASARKRIEILMDLEDAYVHCDPLSMQRVFTNLIMNAVDAIKDTGKIYISVKKDEKNVIISIKDTGEGISQEVLEKIFNPFFTTKKEGTGLGLAIVKKIINDYNGEIKVNSKKGEWTEFIIKLPLYRGEGNNGKQV